MVELARIRTAWPRLQLLAMEDVAVEVAGYRLRHDGGGRRLMGGMGWRTEDVGVSQLVEK